MILMKISSYLILEAEHRHTIRRKCICNPIWLAIAFSLFGTVGYLAFFGRAAVFHIGAVEYQAVLFFARYATHIIRTLDRREIADKQQVVFPVGDQRTKL